MQDILPDSRAKNTKGEIYTTNGKWIPYFCANCGKDSGWCHENSTHMFYLCNNCVTSYGQIAGTMMVPDEVYWDKIHTAIINEYGRELTEVEILKLVEEGTSPLAKLIVQGC